MKQIKEIIEMQGYRIIHAVLAGMLVATAFFTMKEAAGVVINRNAERKTDCVVIDAGHGGDDPGKIGIHGENERDINLEIAKKIQKILEAEDIKTVMTRNDAEGLYDRSAKNKKVQDMKNRIELIEKTHPLLTVSIHQNSYPEEYVKGAQVFYYKDSQESKEAAHIMQKSLKERIDKDNRREAKANGSYYMLKKTSSPIIIVECGFLSNTEEAEKLTQPQYQEKIAWAVSMGIIQATAKENGIDRNIQK